MKVLTFESKSSFDKFSAKTISNALFVRENDISINDKFTVNEGFDVIKLLKNGKTHFILKDDIKYFK